MFEFYIAWDDSSANFNDMSWLNQEIDDSNGFVGFGDSGWC